MARYKTFPIAIREVLKAAHAGKCFVAFQDLNDARAQVARAKTPDAKAVFNTARGTVEQHCGAVLTTKTGTKVTLPSALAGAKPKPRRRRRR